MLRHEMKVAFGHFNIISENLIVSNLQRGDSRLLSLFRFQLKNPSLAFPANLSQIIQFLIVVRFYEASFSNGQRWIFNNGGFQKVMKIVKAL